METPQKSKSNALLWLLVVLLLIGGMVANYYFAEVVWSLRLAGWIVLVCVMAAIALQTVQGQTFWEFAKAARGELRKVSWPTRPETIQTTLVVIVIVIIVALVLWGIDSLLLWFISWVTGYGG